jgi:hypothetical protein
VGVSPNIVCVSLACTIERTFDLTLVGWDLYDAMGMHSNSPGAAGISPGVKVNSYPLCEPAEETFASVHTDRPKEP